MSQSAVSRRSVPIAIVLLLLTSSVPAPFSQWVRWFGDLAVVLVTPVSGPASMVSRWLAPATRTPAPPEDIAALETEVEHFRTLILRYQKENEDLWARIRDLENNASLTPDAPVRIMSGVQVIGDTADLSSGIVRLRAGARQGVVKNTVVAVGGTQLFGRVVNVSPAWCEARPITAKDAEAIHTIIVAGNNVDAPKLLCRLEPQGDGTLKGPVEHKRIGEGGEKVLAEAGHTVFLSDDTWPRNSQMLIVGHVRSVDVDPNNALRQIVVVTPGGAGESMRLPRVTEVVLRMTPEDDS